MKKLLWMLALSMLVIGLGACGSDKSNDKEEGSNADDNAAQEEETITVKHELGETDVDKNPEKVVVFDYGTLDSLDKLGVEVVGIPKSGTVPSYLSKYEDEKYENVGGLKEPDLEKIAEIDPDLIIISGRQSSVYDELKKLGPTIYMGVDTTRYMDSFHENLEVLGQIFDKEDEVKAEEDKIKASIEALKEKATENDQKALVILANDDKISAYGSQSRFGIIHDVFGVPAVDEDIEASTHGMNVTFEYVVEKDPDLLYVVDRTAVVGGESSAKQVVENDLVKNTKAYKEENITYLNPEYWYLSGGGLQSVQEMINEIDASLK